MDIATAFSLQADNSPETTAVLHSGTKTTYQELSRYSRRVAAALQRTTGSQPKVFLAMAPSPYTYASMIGTLMAGGTFCPIDIEGPTERNLEILQSFKADVLLYESELSPSLLSGEQDIRVIDVRALPRRVTEMAGSTPRHNETAYVVFTSGSTGRPKGVAVGRSAFSHFTHIAQKYFQVRIGERWGQFSNLGYDIAIMDVFMALCHGGTLVTFASASDRFFPGRAIRKHGVKIWQSVPSIVDLMLRSGHLEQYLHCLRIMSFCGEPLQASHLDSLFRVHPDLVVFNTYGATETTGFNTLNYLTSDNYRSSCNRGPIVALGQEVPGWEIILSGGPSESEGQIVVCGDNIALGYWNDEPRTQKSFRKLSVGDKTVRAYHTGDWGERVDKTLYFRGRIDRQVKVKGERIELDEIDYRLREAGFKVAASILEGEAIYSFVETASPVEEQELRNILAKQLPFHAIPRQIFPLEKLPRNQNGKIAFAELQTVLAEKRRNGKYSESV